MFSGKIGSSRGFNKGWAPGKLTGCGDDFAPMVSPSGGKFLL